MYLKSLKFSFCFIAALLLGACATNGGSSSTQSPKAQAATQSSVRPYDVKPVKYFFQDPKYTQMTLSPNGQYLAALAPLPSGNHRMNIVVLNASDLSQGQFITALDRGDVLGFTWANNERLLFTVDAGGTESRGIYGVDRIGGSVDNLIVPPIGAGLTSFRSATIMDITRDDPDSVLVTWNKRRLYAPDVFKMDVTNGATLAVARNPGDVGRWLTDHNGNVRVAVAQDGAYIEIRYRGPDGGDWEVLKRFNPAEEPGFVPVTFAYDNQRLLVLSNIGHDTAALYYYNPETGEMGDMIYDVETYDVGGPMMSEAKQKMIGVGYTGEKSELVYFDEEEKALQQNIKRSFPNKMVRVTSSSRDGSRRIYTVFSDTDPGSYYLYDEDTGQFRFLAQRMPWVEPAEMVAMKPVQYTARDGRTIHGYLTLPDAEKFGDGPYATIINPHGGPFGVRDSWGFNREHQFLANRGYAVLQVNFRGSGGYGRDFLQAGFDEWGKNMQHDVSDGVKWAIEQGYAAADRVCIYGASYGGYATMAGLTFTPELYQCGINYVGVTSVPLLFETMPEAWKLAKEQFKARVGDPETEMERLKAISPINYVKNIDDPVFIIHGENDPRVDIKHAEWLREKLEAQGKPYEWLVKANEGHGFKKEENVLQLYNMMDDFLAENLPVRPTDSVATN